MVRIPSILRKFKTKSNQMRNLIYAINLTIDGCCDHTKVSGSEEILEFFTDLLRDVDLIVYGRKTYELMIPYWPETAKDPSSTKAEIEFAQTFTAIDKVVFSRSLDSAEGNTRIVRANPGEELLKLKQEKGKNISVGGVSLPEQLIALDLVDEYYFVIHPVIVGEGRRLLEHTGLQEKLNVKLAGSKILKSGCVALHYLKQ
jgi:dihydrofolate reductase